MGAIQEMIIESLFEHKNLTLRRPGKSIILLSSSVETRTRLFSQGFSIPSRVNGLGLLTPQILLIIVQCLHQTM